MGLLRSEELALLTVMFIASLGDLQESFLRLEEGFGELEEGLGEVEEGLGEVEVGFGEVVEGLGDVVEEMGEEEQFEEVGIEEKAVGEGGVSSKVNKDGETFLSEWESFKELSSLPGVTGPSDVNRDSWGENLPI